MIRIKILLADDHTLIREGFKSLLGRTDDFELVGEAEDGKQLMELIPGLLPDVVLADITMPHMTGLEVLIKIQQKFPAIKFIVLSMHEEREYVLRALDAGAKGYLLKSTEKAELERAIRTVYAGGKYFSPAVATILAESIARVPSETISDLTPREKEVLTLVAQGKSSKQIADQLDISIRTVESHRINMLKKLNSANTAELITKSIQLKLITQ